MQCLSFFVKYLGFFSGVCRKIVLLNISFGQHFKYSTNAQLFNIASGTCAEYCIYAHLF